MTAHGRRQRRLRGQMDDADASPHFAKRRESTADEHHGHRPTIDRHGDGLEHALRVRVRLFVTNLAIVIRIKGSEHPVRDARPWCQIKVQRDPVDIDRHAHRLQAFI